MPKKPQGRSNKAQNPSSSQKPSQEQAQMIDFVRSTLVELGDEIPEEMRAMIEIGLQQAGHGDFDFIEELHASFMSSLSEMEPDADEEDDDDLYLAKTEAIYQIAKLSDDNSDAKFDQAAKAALKIDPHAVEVFYLLGERASTDQERLANFRKASEAATHKPAPLVARVMPRMRRQMADVLSQHGQISDAYELLYPALAEDPDDDYDVRGHLVSLALRMNQNDKAEQLCREGEFEADGLIAYALAIIEYRRNGATEQANKMLERAEKLAPDIAAYLTGAMQLPADELESLLTDTTYIVFMLAPVLEATPGAKEWIEQTLDTAIQVSLEMHSEDDNDEEDDEYDDDDMEAEDELRQSDEEWHLVIVEDSESDGSEWVAAAISGDSLIQIDVLLDEPTDYDLQQFLMTACEEPMDGPPRLPRIIYVEKGSLKADIASWCDDYAVECKVKKLSQEGQRKVELFRKQLARARQVEQAAKKEDWSAEDLAGLPLSQDEWALGCMCPMIIMGDEAMPTRVWMVVIANSTTNQVLAFLPLEEKPTWDKLDRLLISTMHSPMSGIPQRVERISIDLGMAKLDIQGKSQFELVEGSQKVYDEFTFLISHFLQQSNPTSKALRDVERVDDDFLRALYEEAAELYELQPWKQADPMQLLEIHCKAWPDFHRAVSVMGHLGQSMGLMCFYSADQARSFVKSMGSKTSVLNALVLDYSDYVHSAVDQWNLERSGYRVANENAMPSIMLLKSGELSESISYDDLVDLRTMIALVRLSVTTTKPVELEQGHLKITAKWVPL